MVKINRLNLLLQVIAGIVFLGILLFIVYLFTRPSTEGFQELDQAEKDEEPIQKGEITIFLTQFLEIRDLLYNHFKIGPSEIPELYTVKTASGELSITKKNPPAINREENAKQTKQKTVIGDVNPEFIKKFTRKIAIELADIIGYYEMKKSFFDEIQALPINEREEYYTTRKTKHNQNNELNVNSWGYVGALVEKYLQGYPFLYFENPLEEFQNESDIAKVLTPIVKSPNEVLEFHFDSLTLLQLPSPTQDESDGKFKDFDQSKHRKYEMSLINTKQVLRLLKCYLLDKLDSPFDDTIDCDKEKTNEQGVQIIGYNVFSLSVNK